MPWKPGTTPIDTAGTWRWRRRQLRNGAIVALVLIALGHAAGVPHPRWEHQYTGSYSNPTILSGTYVGPTGLHRFDAVERECSLIVFLKPEAPLWGWLGELTEQPS